MARLDFFEGFQQEGLELDTNRFSLIPYNNTPNCLSPLNFYKEIPQNDTIS